MSSNISGCGKKCCLPNPDRGVIKLPSLITFAVGYKPPSTVHDSATPAHVSRSYNVSRGAIPTPRGICNLSCKIMIAELFGWAHLAAECRLLRPRKTCTVFICLFQDDHALRTVKIYTRCCSAVRSYPTTDEVDFLAHVYKTK